MSDEERALLRGICAQPDDDVPRLVYADWLEEQDRYPRAEFIRLQCHLYRALSDPTQREYRSRLIDNLQDLVNAYSWDAVECPITGELEQSEHIRTTRSYLRGFRTGVDLAPNIPQAEILQIVELSLPFKNLYHRSCNLERVSEFFHSGVLNQIQELHLLVDVYTGTGQNFSVVLLAENLQEMVDAEWPQSLTRFALFNKLGTSAVELLLRTPLSKYLPILDLSECGQEVTRYAVALRHRFDDRVRLPDDM